MVTDHSALRWLHSIEPKGRIARWIMDLLECSFDVRNWPGSEDVNADALSRLVSTDYDQGANTPTKPIPTCATTVTPGYNLQEASRPSLKHYYRPQTCRHAQATSPCLVSGPCMKSFLALLGFLPHC